MDLHPLDPVPRLLLDQAEASQDADDVQDSAGRGLQVSGRLLDVHDTVSRRHQQLQETPSQQGQRSV